MFLVQLSTRETLIDMRNTIVSNAKGFAFIGFMFAGTVQQVVMLELVKLMQAQNV